MCLLLSSWLKSSSGGRVASNARLARIRSIISTSSRPAGRPWPEGEWVEVLVTGIGGTLCIKCRFTQLIIYPRSKRPVAGAQREPSQVGPHTQDCTGLSASRSPCNLSGRPQWRGLAVAQHRFPSWMLSICWGRNSKESLFTSNDDTMVKTVWRELNLLWKIKNHIWGKLLSKGNQRAARNRAKRLTLTIFYESGSVRFVENRQIRYKEIRLIVFHQSNV